MTPKPLLNYYNIVSSPEAGKPDAFTVELVHMIYFKPNAAPTPVGGGGDDGGDGERGGKQAAVSLQVAWVLFKNVFETFRDRDQGTFIF